MLINATNITFLLCASNWNRCLPSLTSVLDGDQHHAPGGFAPWYKALIVYWVCPSAFLGTFKEINNSLPHSQPNKISSYTQFVAWPLYRLSYPASLISVGCVILFSFHLLLRLSSVLLHWAFPSKILYVFISPAYYTQCQNHFSWFNRRNVIRRRSQWPRGQGRRSAATRLLRLWVRITPEAWMPVCRECCVLSGRGLCVGLITRPEESYRLCCICVWSWNLVNVGAMAGVGPQRHREIILLGGLSVAELWPIILATHLRRLLIK